MRLNILATLCAFLVIVFCTSDKPETAEIRVTNNDSVYSINFYMRPIPFEDTVPILLFDVEPLSEKIADYDVVMQESIPGVEFGEYSWNVMRAYADPPIIFTGTLSIYNDKHGTYDPIDDTTGKFEWLDN
ncbi:hypothetical protein ES705_23355 [subsurface metagenome]